jgi:hypothetical protein
MTRTVTETTVCDLGDGDAAETVRFDFGGRAFDIDLCGEHAAAMGPMIDVYGARARAAGARRMQRRAGLAATGRPRRSKASRDHAASVRRWAAQQGIEVSDRGRLPAAVVAKYEAAH